MDIQTNHLTIYLALGSTAARAIGDFRETQRCLGPEVHGRPRDRVLMIGLEKSNDGKVQSSTMTFPSETEGGIAGLQEERIPTHIWDAADNFLKTASRVTTDAMDSSTTFSLDVVIAGEIGDRFFLDNFLKTAVTVNELVFSRYEALGRIMGDTKNAAFFMIPIGLSENLQAEPQASEIISLLMATEEWHRQLDNTKGDPKGCRRCIPRFNIFDGFVKNGRIPFDDQTDMISDFLSLVTDDGIRSSTELRSLFGFSPSPDDFISVFSTATISFPVNLIEQYCCSHTLISFCDTLLGSPMGESKKEMDTLFQNVLSLLDTTYLEQRFDDAESGMDLLALIAESVPEFYSYEADPGEKSRTFWERTLPKTGEDLSIERKKKSHLHLQETYLPAIGWDDPPETLSDFFSRKWQQYPVDKLTRSDPGSVSTKFSSYHETIDVCGIRLYEKVDRDIHQAVDESLEKNAGHKRLGITIEYLKNDLLKEIKERLHRWEKEKLNQMGKDETFLGLPDVPVMDAFVDHARRFRSMIWNRPPAKVLLIWLPLFVFFFFMAFYNLFHLAAAFLGGSVSRLASLTYLLKPPYDIPVSIAISFMLFALPGFIYHLAVSLNLKGQLRSEYPYRAKLVGNEKILKGFARENEESYRLRRKIRRLEKKIEKMRRRRGILARLLADGQRAVRLYWQARLRLASFIWVRRIMRRAIAVVEDEIAKLDILRLKIEKHRIQVIDRLRELGDTPEDPEQCKVVKPSRPFHAYLLGNDILPDLTVNQRGIRDSMAIASYFIEKYHIHKNWRRHPLFEHMDQMDKMAHKLYSIFDEGMFGLHDYDDKIGMQIDAFFSTLEERLSAGDQLRFFASLEKNKVIQDSGIHIFCHGTAARFVKPAMARHSLSRSFLSMEAKNPNRITVVRVLKDIHIESLMRYMDCVYDPGKQGEGKEEQIEDVWSEHRPRVGKRVGA